GRRGKPRLNKEIMHEMGIATSGLEAVRTEMGLHPGTYPCKVGVRIGEMAAIDQDALRFCFEAIVHETDLESLELGIEVCPRRHRCQVCGREFVVRDYDSRCPQCASLETTCISGDELELAYLEVEEYEPSTVGAKSTQ
ncbi:MAG: hydrogenase maturation nickel metallochaperone HypA, partial [Candidatus Acidiferrales bacterium]